MDIILIAGAKSRSRTLTIDWRHWSAAALLMAGLGIVLTLSANGLASRIESVLAHAWLSKAMSGDDAAGQKDQELLQDHINAMAVRVGELQARLSHLDGLGERLARLAGLKPSELPSLQPGATPGRGGAESSQPSQAFSVPELTGLLDKLTREVEQRSDRLGVLETLLLQDSVKRKFMPTLAPIVDGWFSSNFGYRINPFTGLQSFHEGIDFPAEPDTPIVAAASGTVTSTEVHPQYGKMVEINHGNGLVSRYAHTSRVFVKEGELVQRGQRVASVGSTGRSTGPHLHFEVRENGVPQNPIRFLQSSN